MLGGFSVGDAMATECLQVCPGLVHVVFNHIFFSAKSATQFYQLWYEGTGRFFFFSASGRYKVFQLP